jgi:hypothetical protein
MEFGKVPKTLPLFGIERVRFMIILWLGGLVLAAQPATLADNPRITQLQRRHVERFHPHRPVSGPTGAPTTRGLLLHQLGMLRR